MLDAADLEDGGRDDRYRVDRASLMFLGAYHFVGDEAELLEGYRRLLGGYPPGSLDLQVCIRTADGLTVFDACPSEEVFRSFSASAELAAAIVAAGLPSPTAEPLGDVQAAEVTRQFRP